jgi:hypothetical protein
MPSSTALRICILDGNIIIANMLQGFLPSKIAIDRFGSGPPQRVGIPEEPPIISSDADRSGRLSEDRAIKTLNE